MTKSASAGDGSARALQEHFRIASLAANLGTFAWDVPQDRLEVSEYTERLFGIPRGGMGNRFENLIQQMRPEYREHARAAMQVAIQGGGEFYAEFEYDWPGGLVRGMQVRGTVLFDEQGTPQRVVGAIWDATELMRAKNELEARGRQMERYLVAVESAHLAAFTWFVDEDRFESDALNESVLGFASGAFQGTLASLIGLVHPDDRDGLSRDWSTAVERGGEFRFDFRTVQAPRGERWIRSTGRVFAEGGPRRLAGVHQDVTAEVEAQRALETARAAAESASRAKSTFLSSMSHEIRTPMNAVIGMTSILSDTSLRPEQKDAVEVIRASGEHLLTVINDILDYSKIEAGRLELEHQVFSLRDCIESVFDLVATTARHKGVEVGYLMGTGSPETLRGDVGRLRQILANLMANAVKFTAEGGHVFLETKLLSSKGEDRDLEISVQDTGIGMDPSTVERLFQPFMQADASITRAFGGTGLGLSISRRLAELMGGAISVESALGEGSTFRLRFTAPVAESPAPAPPTGVVPALKGRRVLIVDDVDINRQILCHYTALWEMIPKATASAAEALEWVKRGEPFDLALLDYHMPRMDGLELARELRKLRDARTLPIMMLSSVAIDMRENGVLSASMMKPIKPSRLLDSVSHLFVQRGRVERIDPAPQNVPQQLAAEHPLRILVAEDNVVNQKVARLLFQKMGYQPDFVANGAEAVAAVERQTYDVLFMDVQMPVLDGLQATRAICDRQGAARPRIVGMSASVMAEDRQAAADAGMDDYVSKPVPAQTLVKVLKSCERRGT